MTWWVHELWQDGRVAELLSQIFWVIFSITLHELAHGWAAIRQGDDTPRRLHRMTLNPLVHMGPWSLAVFAMIGIAWGVMPIDPSRFRSGRTGRLIVAAAGPAMNASLAFVSLTALAVWAAVGPEGKPIYDNLKTFLAVGGWLNIVLAIFNLLPVPPLDGSVILSALSRRAEELYARPQAALVGLFVLVLVVSSGVIRPVYRACGDQAARYVAWLTGLLVDEPDFEEYIEGLEPFEEPEEFEERENFNDVEELESEYEIEPESEIEPRSPPS